MKIKKQTLFWGVIAWLFFIAAFFGYQFLGVMNGEVAPRPEGQINRVGEYSFYLIFLAGLFLLKFWLDKRRSGKKKHKDFLFLLKTLVASYAIGFVISMMALGTIHIAFSSAMFGTFMDNLQLVIFTVTLILCPIVYRKII